MENSRLHRHLFWAVITAESTHVFCCVLPTIVTALSLVSGVGLIGSVPAVLLDLHDFLHEYEIPVIIFSAAMLGLGWALYALAAITECERDHCEPHETVCPPQKKMSRRILVVASVLFVMNLTIYFTLHRDDAALSHSTPQQSEDVHHHHP